MNDETAERGSTGSRRQRLEAYPLRWAFLTGSRRTLAVFLSASILLFLVAVGTTWEIEMETLVTETRAIQTLFNTLLGGIILFVSVVLSINTAFLSEESGPLRTKQTQVEDSIAYQMDLEQSLGSGVSPAEVGGFYRFVAYGIRRQTDALLDATRERGESRANREVTAFAETVAADVERIRTRLRSGNRDVPATLLAGLDFDYAARINRARYLEWQYDGQLDDAQLSALESLQSILTHFASGREYFTTLYYRREVRSLSSDLLVLSLPVIVFTSFVLLAIDAGLFPTATAFGIQPRLLYVSIAFVIALSPYVLLSSYMLRILVVSKYSLDPGGFTLTSGDID
ncbi:hypothetical protein [Halopelagius fulvigenes]|uniref:Uncharacterized protein n=1 Tax=Halopelagius fulvigenes TaxID=1198324 RepID=A0ABD5U3Z6_9EURY